MKSPLASITSSAFSPDKSPILIMVSLIIPISLLHGGAPVPSMRKPPLIIIL